MRIVCWSRMEAVDWSRMDAVDWSTFNPGRASGNITSVSASIPCTSGSDLRLLKKCSGRAAAGARTRWMSWLSCERRSVSPWRLTISWISLDEQRRTNSPSSWAALAWGIPNTPASPSSHARICRSTLHLISSLHPSHNACKIFPRSFRYIRSAKLSETTANTTSTNIQIENVGPRISTPLAFCLSNCSALLLRRNTLLTVYPQRDQHSSCDGSRRGVAFLLRPYKSRRKDLRTATSTLGQEPETSRPGRVQWWRLRQAFPQVLA